jgi:hypothetical protein
MKAKALSPSGFCVERNPMTTGFFSPLSEDGLKAPSWFGPNRR